MDGLSLRSAPTLGKPEEAQREKIEKVAAIFEAKGVDGFPECEKLLWAKD
jgi:hypothetical protein